VSYRIATTSGGTFTNVNFEPDHTTINTFSETFTVNAPAANGTYNIYFYAYSNDTCNPNGGGQSALFTLNNAVIVAPNTPTITPTNTPVPPTNTPTNTPVPPTNTPTNTHEHIGAADQHTNEYTYQHVGATYEYANEHAYQHIGAAHQHTH
jgi:hypothetical protein